MRRDIDACIRFTLQLFDDASLASNTESDIFVGDGNFQAGSILVHATIVLVISHTIVIRFVIDNVGNLLFR